MNAELRGLIREAGVELDLDWRNVAILYNYAPVPRPTAAPADVERWNRGFNLVLLEHGHPRFFVKCRPTGDRILAWETEIRTALAGSRPDGLSVAPVKTATSPRVTVQVSAFLLGPHYGKLVP